MKKPSELKRLRERIMELEAMVAMAEQPSPDNWDVRVCLSWVHEQRKIRRRLDKIAAKMKAKEAAKSELMDCAAVIMREWERITQ